MGLQFDAGRHCIENRRESVILYDGEWYTRKGGGAIFAAGKVPQSVEVTKELLAYWIAFFDNPDMRDRFGMADLIIFAKNEIESERDLDDVIQD